LKDSAVVIFADMKGFKGYERGLVPIAGKPMIEYVLEGVPDDVSDIFIAVDDEKKAHAYNEIAEEHWAKVVVSENISHSTREKIEFAISTASSSSVLVLPCDIPLVTREFTSFLIEASVKFPAVIPRNQMRESMYLIAAYQTKPFIEVFLRNPKDDMDSIVKKVCGILYLSSNSLKIFDEKLLMFMRVSSPVDVKRVENILKRKKISRE